MLTITKMTTDRLSQLTKLGEEAIKCNQIWGQDAKTATRLSPPQKETARLKRRDAAIQIANADRLIHLGQKDLAIANLARSGALHDRVNGGFDDFVVDNHFQLDLRQQVDRVFASAIGFGVALLPAMPAHLEYRHPINAHLRQGFFDVFEFGGLNHRFNLVHGSFPVECE